MTETLIFVTFSESILLSPNSNKIDDESLFLKVLFKIVMVSYKKERKKQYLCFDPHYYKVNKLRENIFIQIFIFV